MSEGEKINRLKDLLLSSENPYVLTGAGISTESGIPDFRGKDGLWTKIDPMQYSTREVLMASPEKFYEYGFPRFKELVDKEPNKGHYALADLEKEGIIKGIITQNIDGLHNKAGAKQVFEVHGHTKSCHCLSCKKEYPFNELIRQLDELKVEVPNCENCNGILRPDIVLFGDQMPDLFFKIATVLKQKCDFLLVVGTSLQVYPVAALAELGAPLGIINLDETPFDTQAKVVIRSKCSEALNELRKLINEEIEQ